MRKCKLILLLLFCVTSFTQLVAQDKKLTGKVFDANNGQPLAGVTIAVKGTKKAVGSNNDGSFTITTKEGADLIVSTLGYTTQTIKAAANMTVTLQGSAANLQDVVVVGYGTQKRANVTAAVATVKGEQLINRPVASTSMALQGFVPGLTVRQSSGQPGADGGALNIRGISSISNTSSPLIIADGVEGVSLNDIDPNVIETISVLKDAASTAVYGVRGTNGVILITTKRGQKGKTQIAVNSFVNLQQATNMPETLSAVDNMILNNEAVSNTGSTSLPFSQATINNYRTLPADNFNIFNTDWQTAIFQNTGIMQNHNMIVSGGSDKSSFLVSGTYLNQQGLILNNSFKKYDLRMNGDIAVTNKVKFSTDLFYTKSTNTQPAGGGSPSSIIQRAITMAKNFPGKFGPGQYGDAGQSNNINPIGLVEGSGIFQAETPTLSVRFSLKAEVAKNLTLEVAYNSRSSWTQSYRANTTYDVFTPNPATASLTRVGPFGGIDSSLNYSNSRGNSNQYFATANYAVKVARVHDIKVQTGFQGLDNTSQSTSATAFGLQYPDRPYLNLATSPLRPTVGGSATQNSLAGFFTRINYSYADKYILEITGRYDGASRFAQSVDKQWGLFGGASAGWILTKERFMEKVPFINFAKLRLSYGTLGNQEIGDNYPFVAALNPGTASYFNNLLARGFSLQNIANFGLSWEKSTQKNIGLDVNFLKNKLNVTFDYYEKEITDMIIDLPLPSYAGYISGQSNVPTNAASMVNKGWELSIGYKDQIGKFKYGITANISDVKNMVLDTKNQDIVNGNTLSRAGYSINSYLLYQTNGLYQLNENFNVPTNGTRFTGAGDIKYLDTDGNGILNAADRVLVGNNFPRYEYSVDLSASYKGFDLNVFLYGVAKRDNYISGVGVEPFNAGNWIASGLTPVLDRWTPTNTGAKYPRLYSGGNGNYISSSYWLRNGAFMRIKNITLGYNVPKKIMDKLRIQQFRIYASVVNPFTFSNYEPGFDPEPSNQNGAFYPIMRTSTIGINFKF